MPLIQFVSPKGGVGRTTLCANLGFTLRGLGYPVVLVDLDPQNSLHLHFSLSAIEGRGVIDRFDVVGEWRHLLLNLNDDDAFDVLPFGVASNARLRTFQEFLAQPGWLIPRLRSLATASNTLVLVDTPVTTTLADAPLTVAADLTLVTLMADAGSLAVLPQLGSSVDASVSSGWRESKEAGRIAYLLNQVDSRSRLKREIAELMLGRLSPVLGTIHRDESVAEALADQRSVMEQAPFSAAARDIEEAARAIAQRFPLHAANAGRGASSRSSAAFLADSATSGERT